MRWVRDVADGLAERPHYEPAEIDEECERRVTDFLRRRHGTICYPLSTDDLTVLIEQSTADLDLYADLSAEGPATEGVTEFLAGSQPRVRISAALSEAPSRERRLRTTLAHELGHVVFHSFLWRRPQPSRPWKPAADADRNDEVVGPVCRRDTILRAAAGDWLEWQAGYASGAFLMPAGAVASLAHELRPGFAVPIGATATSPRGRALVRAVQRRFHVSAEAARIRLLKLGHLAHSRRSTPIWTRRQVAIVGDR